MPSVGQIEKKTQERVLALLSQRLGYTDLGDWIDRPANSNIEPERLKAWLTTQGVSDALAARALFELQKVANDTRKSSNWPRIGPRGGRRVPQRKRAAAVGGWARGVRWHRLLLSQAGEPKVVRRLQRPLHLESPRRPTRG